MIRLQILLCAVLLLPNIYCDFFNFQNPFGKSQDAILNGNKFVENANRAPRETKIVATRDQSSEASVSLSSNAKSNQPDTFVSSTESSVKKEDNKRESRQTLAEMKRELIGINAGNILRHAEYKREDINGAAVKDSTQLDTLDKRSENNQALIQSDPDISELHDQEENFLIRQIRQDDNITHHTEIRQDDNSTHHPEIRQDENVTRNQAQSSLIEEHTDLESISHLVAFLEDDTRHALEKRQDNNVSYVEKHQDDINKANVEKRQDDNSTSLDKIGVDRHFIEKHQDESTAHRRNVRGNRFLDEYRHHLVDRFHHFDRAPNEKRSLSASREDNLPLGNDNAKDHGDKKLALNENSRGADMIAEIAEVAEIIEETESAKGDKNLEQRSAMSQPSSFKADCMSSGQVNDQIDANERLKRNPQTSANLASTRKYDAEDYDIDDEDIDDKEFDMQNKRENNPNKKSGGKRWDHWGAWTPCSVSCGIGKVTRWRHCLGPGCAPGEKEAQIKTCSLSPCT